MTESRNAHSKTEIRDYPPGGPWGKGTLYRFPSGNIYRYMPVRSNRRPWVLVELLNPSRTSAKATGERIN